jgi:hypothetical protein
MNFLNFNQSMNRKTGLIFLFIIIIAGFTGCVAGSNVSMDVPSPDGQVAGFISGLWQGFIAPVTFIISLFTDKISIYEVHNSGGWYDFGFVLGAGILFGGSSRATKGSRAR